MYRYLIVLSMVVLSVACQAESQQPALRIVTELSPPHQTLENGEVAGISTSIVKAVLQQAGLDASIEVYPWARAYYIASNTPNVLIYNIARTPERETEFHWIGPVASYRLGLARLAERTDLNPSRPEQLQNYSVAAQRDDFAVEVLASYGLKAGRDIQLAADILESWRLLLNGKVDYVIDDAMAIPYTEQQLKLPEGTVRFVLAIKELEQQTYLAASKNTDPALLQKLLDAHQQIQSQQLYQQVMLAPHQAQP